MKKNRSLIVALTLSALAVILMAGATTARAKEIKLTYACLQPPTDVHSRLVEAWIKEVENQTDGRVKINFFPGQTLIKAAQTYDGVLNGLTDIGFSILQYTRGRFPLMDFINLPMGYPSGPVNTAIINEVFEKFKPAELNDVKVLYLHAHGPGYIHTKKQPVHEMKDLKGLKFRSHGPTAEMLKALGGTPTALPMPELYQALQKGVVQGGVWDLSASIDWKLAEVIDYTIACSPIAYSLGFFVVMNKEKWESLEPDVQNVIEQLDLDWVAKHGQAWQNADTRGINFSLQHGKSIIGIAPEEAAKWRKAVRPVIETYLKETESKGLPGKEVIEYVEQRLEDARKGQFKSKYMSSQE